MWFRNVLGVVSRPDIGHAPSAIAMVVSPRTAVDVVYAADPPSIRGQFGVDIWAEAALQIQQESRGVLHKLRRKLRQHGVDAAPRYLGLVSAASIKLVLEAAAHADVTVFEDTGGALSAALSGCAASAAGASLRLPPGWAGRAFRRVCIVSTDSSGDAALVSAARPLLQSSREVLIASVGLRSPCHRAIADMTLSLRQIGAPKPRPIALSRADARSGLLDGVDLLVARADAIAPAERDAASRLGVAIFLGG